MILRFIYSILHPTASWNDIYIFWTFVSSKKFKSKDNEDLLEILIHNFRIAQVFYQGE